VPMNRKVVFIGLLLMLSAFSIAHADELVMSVSAPSQVASGERFRLVYTLNARPESFQAPSFEGFRLVSGPSQSTSSSTQIINNQVTTSLSVSYTYILEALQEGEFSIPPASATANGETVTGNPVRIVVSGQAPAASPQTPRQQPGQQRAGQTPQAPGEEDLFIRATVSNQNPFESEQVVVSYRIYTRVPITRYSVERLPSFQGFWSENLDGPSQPEVTTEVIDGITYNVAEIRRVALFPQRPGELTVEPLEVECMVRLRASRGSLFDDFFSGTPFDNFQNIPVNIRSNQIRLNVRPLPVQNRPPSFTGLVGRFDVSGSLNPQELHVNEAANLKIIINGKGNLGMMQQPEFHFSADLEVFDPLVEDRFQRESDGIRGTRTFDYLVIPRAGGDFEIPAMQLSFFDPGSQRYVTREVGPFTLRVSGRPGSGQAVAGGQEGIRQLGSDIRFINTSPFTLRPAGQSFFKSRAFYLWLSMPFLLFIAVLIYWRRQVRLHADVTRLRTRKARKLARKRLGKARIYLQNEDRSMFFNEISRALWGYFSDRLALPVSALSRENIAEMLAQNDIPAGLAQATMDAMETCEFARFAPGEKDSRMEETYHLALSTIVELEKEFRKRKKT
jgi:hypothetical protein